MTYPITGIATVTVLGRYLHLITGRPVTGSVRFTPQAYIAVDELLVPQPVTVPLDIRGEIEVQLPVGADDVTLPVVAYYIEELLEAPARGREPFFLVFTPADADTTTYLSDVEVETVPDLSLYMLKTGGVITGPVAVNSTLSVLGSTTLASVTAGTVTAGALNGTAITGGTVETTGAIHAGGAVTGNSAVITNNASVGGDLTVDGVLTANSFTGTVTTTNLHLAGTLDVDGTANVDGNLTIGGNLSWSGAVVGDLTATGDIYSHGVKLIPDRRFNVKSYGAVGNGTKAGGGTDDTAAIQAAITACAAAGGGTVFLPAGGYKITARLNNTNPHVFIRGEGIGVTYLWHSIISTGLDYVYRSNGNFAPHLGIGSTMLSSNAAYDYASYANSVAVALTSTSGLAVNDFIMIGDNFDESMDSNGWIDRFRGEYVKIRAISGNNLTLWSALRDDYTTDRQAQVWKAVHNTDCGISDLSIIAADGVQHTTFTGGIWFSASTSSHISDVEVAGTDGAGIALGFTIDTVIDNPHIHDLSNDPAQTGPPAVSSRLGYNISVGPSEGTKITGGIIKNGRHGVTTGGANTFAGWARGLTVTGVRIEESDAAALDTHPATTDVSFIGNHIDRCRSIGISCRSGRTTIQGNTIERTADAGIWIDRKSAIETNIIGNTISQAGGFTSTAGYGIQFNGRRIDPANRSTGDTDGVPDKTLVVNNVIRQTYLEAVRFAVPITNAVIASNKFEYCNLKAPTTGGAISFNVDLDGVTGLRVEQNTASGVNAVVLSTGGTCTNSVFLGNALVNGVGSTPTAIKGGAITGGTNNIIHGNIEIASGGRAVTHMDQLEANTVFLANGTEPATPTGGVKLWSNGGVLQAKQSNGTNVPQTS